MSEPIAVDVQSFPKTVLEATMPVLVDFWAPWCGPCKRIAPIVDELAAEYDGRVLFTKVNTDESSAIAQSYGIRSIPTLLVFKGGKPVSQLVGLQPKRELKARLDEALA